jgi:hypothetical protein
MNELLEIALATVGMTEVLKNFIQKGGKKAWTLAALLVGALMVVVKIYLPEQVLMGIVAVSGAVVFYDTIFKAFQKFFQKIGDKTE